MSEASTTTANVTVVELPPNGRVSTAKEPFVSRGGAEPVSLHNIGPLIVAHLVNGLGRHVDRPVPRKVVRRISRT